MVNQRIFSTVLIMILSASTQACGQSPDTPEGAASNTAQTAAPQPTANTPPSTPAQPTNAAPQTTTTPNPEAATGATPQTTPSTASTDQAGATVTKNIYCPDVKKLKKINMFWGAPGGWRSYSESFVNVIDGFTGAQWIGVNVGKMLCIYRSKSTFEFPVVIQNDTLTPAPAGDKWIKQPGGYYNCISGDLLECPFRFEEEKSSETNVYKELDFFKGKKDYLENNSTKP
jgi:hypothetical protein